MIIRIILVILGIILIAVSEKAAPLAEAFSGISGKKAGNNGEGSKRAEEKSEEEDILSIKKWRIIVAGFAVLAAIAVFSLISVYTLNKKINTLYESVRNMEEDVGALKAASADE